MASSVASIASAPSSAPSSSSSSSSSSSVCKSKGSSGQKHATSVDGLVKKISKKLSVGTQQTISCAEHKKACEYMTLLKSTLLDPTAKAISAQSKMSLTCSGVYLFKRVVCGDESDDSKADLKRTLALLFVLIVLSNREKVAPDSAMQTGSEEVEMEVEMEVEEGGAPTPTNPTSTSGSSGSSGSSDPSGPSDFELACKEEEDTLAGWKKGCLHDHMEKECSKVPASDLYEQPHQSHFIARLCLVISDRQANKLSFDELTTMACHFFHQSAQAMSVQLFNSISKVDKAEKVDDFLTLSSFSFLEAASGQNNTKLVAIADIAESESGQSVLRDLILSFTLPRSVVGCRRTCILTRETNNVATKQYPEVLGAAHDAAMRGAEYCFADDPSLLYKTCALLAGIAVILTVNAQSIRRDDAFRGRVLLPFLETKIEPQFEYKPRLQYLADTDDWVVYDIKRSTGLPVVEFRGSGFDGCCQACLLFMKSVDS